MNFIRVPDAIEPGAAAFSMLCLNLSGAAHTIAMHEAERVRPRVPKSAEHRLDSGDDDDDEENATLTGDGVVAHARRAPAGR
jgi:hypothetical protein